MIYNLDSSIIIEILRSNKLVTRKMLDATDSGNDLAISSIAYYEVMRGFDKTKPSRRQIIFEQIYKGTIPLPLDEKSLDIATDIYRELHRGQTIGDADIFIAAITLANDAILITDNVKHFGRISNLKFINWKDLDVVKLDA